MGNESTVREITCPFCKARIISGGKFCSECGQNLTGTGEYPPAEENKLATVVFTDLSGYTAMGEHLGAEEVKDIMRRVFAQINRICGKYQGQVDKFIGDCAMLLFGVPTVREDDAIRALAAVHEIHRFVEELNTPELERRIGRRLHMHTGVNSGVVLAGRLDLELGEEKVVGDTVNVASRFADVAKPGEIVVGELTCRLARGHFSFERLPPKTVKGKKEPLQLFRLVGRARETGRSEGLLGMRSELIGRDVEFQTLHRALANLDERNSALVSICAEAGGGKTRLVDEFRESIDLVRYRWYEGHAFAYTRNIPYAVWNDFLSRLWRIDENDRPDDIRRKIVDGIRTCGLEAAATAPYLGSIFAVSFEETEHLDPGFIKTRLFDSTVRLIESLTSPASTVLYFEDLHWADPSSIELLQHIAGEVSSPLLILCAHRPGVDICPDQVRSTWKLQFIEMNLQRLTQEQVGIMLQSLTGSDSLPAKLTDYVQNRIAGNPFFIEEVINNLVESGVLARSDGRIELVGDIESVDVPSTVQGVLAARIDRLEADAKKVLQNAAVIGRTFFYRILQDVSRSLHGLDEYLSLLKKIDIIKEHNLEPELEYMFKHALLQEVVYNSLLKKERRQIHERVASIMESSFAERLPEFYETLAYHYVRAENREKAVYYLRRAGKKSLDRYATEEADSYYRQAYELLVDDDQQEGRDADEQRSAELITLLNEWGHVFYCFGRFQSLVDLFEGHREAAEKSVDLAGQAMYNAWLGIGTLQLCRCVDAYVYARKAIELSEISDDRRCLAYSCCWAATVCAMTGRPVEGEEYGRRAIEMADEFPDDHYLHAKSAYGLAESLNARGRPEAAKSVAQECVSHAYAHNKTRGLALGYDVLADIELAYLHYTVAEEHFRKSGRFAPDAFYRGFSLPFLAHSIASTGRIDEAEETLKRFRTILPFSEAAMYRLSHDVVLARIASFKGQYGRSFRQIAAARDEYRSSGYIWMYLIINLELGRVYTAIALRDEKVRFSVLVRNLWFLFATVPVAAAKAEKILLETVEESRRYDARGQEGMALFTLGRLYRKKRKMQKARASYEGAVDALSQTEFFHELETARAELESITQNR